MKQQTKKTILLMIFSLLVLNTSITNVKAASITQAEIIENIETNIKSTNLFLTDNRAGAIGGISSNVITDVGIVSQTSTKLEYDFKVTRDFEIQFTELTQASKVLDPINVIMIFQDYTNIDGKYYFFIVLDYKEGNNLHSAQFQNYFYPTISKTAIQTTVTKNEITTIDILVGNKSVREDGDSEIKAYGNSFIVKYTLADLQDQATVFKRNDKIKATMEITMEFTGKGSITGDVSDFSITEAEFFSEITGENSFNAFFSTIELTTYIWVIAGFSLWTVGFWWIVILKNRTKSRRRK